jgi:hypothetical protein
MLVVGESFNFLLRFHPTGIWTSNRKWNPNPLGYKLKLVRKLLYEIMHSLYPPNNPLKLELDLSTPF